ncbi:hypothetical protein [Pseudonocardia alaniniphila]|uniref:DNA primase n=1 Tax=Pseudonocardia alaniniphila TaxID=75291 RepID=A0ABS9TG36_9PSEU|nr:hypothetical protein [Pseudonocardia alaniniphila]MCH6167505.1 hypothetical protein [Pseudonocardia alaniniphila]
MKCGARVAIGVVAGYFLGRTKKMKLAMMLGGMAAGRRAGGPGELLRTGTKLLNSSPELARLTDEVRGRLLEAGKGAALAVAARQVESLTDRVGKRVESLSDVGVPSRKKSAEPEDEYEEEDAERADVDDEGAPAGDEDAEEALPPRGARPRARTAKAAPARGGKTAAGATATIKRTAGSASGATRAAGKAAAGRKSSRTPRTPRSDGDG